MIRDERNIQTVVINPAPELELDYIVRWLPEVGYLIDASRANPDAPAWAVEIWVNALAGPGTLLQPDPYAAYWTALEAEALRYSIATRELADSLRRRLVEGRPELEPPAGLARTPWPSHSLWAVCPSADPGDNLNLDIRLQAAFLLATGPDPDAHLDNRGRLRGLHPATMLAGLLVGAGRCRLQRAGQPGWPAPEFFPPGLENSRLLGAASHQGIDFNTRLMTREVAEAVAEALHI